MAALPEADRGYGHANVLLARLTAPTSSRREFAGTDDDFVPLLRIMRKGLFEQYDDGVSGRSLGMIEEATAEWVETHGRALEGRRIAVLPNVQGVPFSIANNQPSLRSVDGAWLEGTLAGISVADLGTITLENGLFSNGDSFAGRNFREARVSRLFRINMDSNPLRLDDFSSAVDLLPPTHLSSESPQRLRPV
jgi:hypothetical protein